MNRKKGLETPRKTMPKDRYQRTIDYLRVSLTDHCNLRCVYCMPLRGLQFAHHNDILTAGEIETVVQAAAAVGFRKVRLTGGEPTLRSDLLEIVRRVSGVDGIEEVCLTTNGVFLPRLADALVEAGLNRINLHIDTLHPEHIKRIMRFTSVDEIWAGLNAAAAMGLDPLKINCVVARDYNDEDVVDMARLTMEKSWHVRFIELMPLGTGECSRTALSQFVPSSETRARIEDALGPLKPVPTANPADEAMNFRIAGALGVVGFISPVSQPYCGTCNRMRLTSDGKLHLCLLHDDEIDVKPALRNGHSARNGSALQAAKKLLLQAVDAKPIGHHLDEGMFTERKRMFQIGG